MLWVRFEPTIPASELGYHDRPTLQLLKRNFHILQNTTVYYRLYKSQPCGPIHNRFTERPGLIFRNYDSIRNISNLSSTVLLLCAVVVTFHEDTGHTLLSFVLLLMYRSALHSSPDSMTRSYTSRNTFSVAPGLSPDRNEGRYEEFTDHRHRVVRSCIA
jgi:hypothetical protein